ncbi:hypothetical protein TrST_g9858 [Triparma strigata]|uniref:START domain-containing protein n=1 Tax=Triparma strigata TaxID=1606541 RepID=A0A9W7AMD1_9STRA|nr:hypothetical protein TrST_g9858 [Triparma strigata]
MCILLILIAIAMIRIRASAITDVNAENPTFKMKASTWGASAITDVNAENPTFKMKASKSTDCSQVLTTYEALFDCVSNSSPCHSCHKSKNTAAEGTEITLATGTYTCSKDEDEHCAGDIGTGSDQFMLALDQPFYTIKCEDDTKSGACVLDGKVSSTDNQRALIHICDSSKTSKYVGKATIIRSITFTNGLTNSKLKGGALYLDGNNYGAKVEMDRCKFVTCGTAIHVDDGRNAASTASFYESSFSDNDVDIELPTGSISTATVWSTCAPGTPTGEPKQGDALKTSGNIFGSLYSFEVGSCTSAFECPPGQYNANQTIDDSSCELCAPGFYSSGTSEDHCRECEQGKFNTKSGQTGCEPCPEGQYQERTNSTSCDLCGKGKFNVDTGSPSRYDCDNCLSGTYTNSPGSSYCQDCGPGFYSAEMAFLCTPCPPGNFQPDSKATNCEICQPGTFTNVTNSTACMNCALGKYTTVSSSVSCTSCPGGKAGNEDRISCTSCAAGKYSVAGSPTCFDCDKGYAAPEDSNHCNYCDAGKYANADTDNCQICAIGKYSVGGVDECPDCPDGKFNQVKGSDSCTSCEPGYVPYYDEDEKVTVCKACEPGKYAEFKFDECKLCEGNGTYSPDEGAAYCKVAGAGTYPTEDRTATNPCPKNHYSTGANDKCSACESGTYSMTGAAGCFPCGQYQTYDPQSDGCKCFGGFITTDFEECTCDAGLTLEAGDKTDKNSQDKCVACEDGRFKGGPGVFGCDLCDVEVIEGAFFSVGDKVVASSCACGPKKYFDFRNNCEESNRPPTNCNPDKETDNRCEPCPENSACTGNEEEVGLTVKNLPIQPGFWRYVDQTKNMYSTVIMQCDVKEACMPASGQDPAQVCTLGHTGPLCSVCEEGHSKNTLGVCEQCVPQKIAFFFYLGAAVVVAVGLYFILRKIFGGKISNIYNPDHRLPMRAKGAGKAWDSLKTKLKILTSFYQIASGLPRTLALTFPSLYQNFCKVVGIIFNIDAVQIISFNCVVPTNFYTTLLMTTLSPLILAALVATLTFFQLRKMDNDEKRQEVLSSRFSIGLCVAYIIFSSTSTVAFETFQCAKYGTYEGFDDTTYYLIADRSINCESEEHKKYEMFAWCMIFVYPIGITVVYAYQLFVYRALIANERRTKDVEDRDEEDRIKHIIFLWKSYTPQCWWFELFENFRRLSLTGMLVFFEAGSAGQLVTALIITIVSLKVFLVFQPYRKLDENVIAELSQWSIFFTLLAAIMIKLKDALVEAHTQEFGLLILFSNVVGATMVVLGLLYKPFVMSVSALRRKHVHESPVKGLEAKHRQKWTDFFDYFVNVTESDSWESISPDADEDKKDGGGVECVVKEVRCGNGDGPIDQIRLSFVVDAKLEVVKAFLLNEKAEGRACAADHEVLGGKARPSMDEGDRGENDVDCFYSVGMKLKLPFLTRDFTLWQKLHEDKGKEEVLILMRTARQWELPRGARIRAETQGRVRGVCKMRGFRLRPESGGQRTKVVFVESLDLRGMLPQDLFTRNYLAPLRFKHVLADMKDMLDVGRDSVPNPLGPVV